MDRKKILWLVSWYPNRIDSFDGDFIQRHAQAAAIENNIHVLFVKAVPENKLVKEVIHHSGDLTEQIIYIKKEHGLLKKLVRQFRWFRHYQKAIEGYIKKNGLPHLVHVHVPWRAGLIALWMKRKYRIPYIVTEHWDIYNEVVADRFNSQPIWMRILIKLIYRNTLLVVPVSHFVANGINRYVMLKKYEVILNVVDTRLFYYIEQRTGPFRFLHVSNMVPKKNVEGLLEAFALFNQKYVEVQLVLIGNKDDRFVSYANSLGIRHQSLFFLGEIPNAGVAAEMQAAHCLILNSDMENSPCVIGEALCCGLPVIATNVGGIPELTNSSNSVLIPPRHTTALVTAMEQMYGRLKKFDRSAIAAAAIQKHSYTGVAAQFTKLYLAVSSRS